MNSENTQVFEMLKYYRGGIEVGDYTVVIPVSRRARCPFPITHAYIGPSGIYVHFMQC